MFLLYCSISFLLSYNPLNRDTAGLKELKASGSVSILESYSAAYKMIDIAAANGPSVAILVESFVLDAKFRVL